jgi:hypothetical protein
MTGVGLKAERQEADNATRPFYEELGAIDKANAANAGLSPVHARHVHDAAKIPGKISSRHTIMHDVRRSNGALDHPPMSLWDDAWRDDGRSHPRPAADGGFPSCR